MKKTINNSPPPAKRKGATSIRDIPADILLQLNQGEIETANLMEWLAVDQELLLKNVLRQTGRMKYLDPIITSLYTLKKQSASALSEAIGAGLLAHATKHKDTEFLLQLPAHASDLVRCWAAYTVGKNQQLPLVQLFQNIRPFAADGHFGVREIAWLAVRPRIAKHLGESLKNLITWTKSTDENVRRFASEATRPRGVWCAHIEALKQNPELGLPVLEPLKSDKAKYVQDSVGNWLNDASKTQPQFVMDICNNWRETSPTKETAYIIKKAMRTIEK